MDPLISGALAGFAVDLALYPLDTIKTRLQSPQGFLRSGGLGGIYKGMAPALMGSIPSAALFFYAYQAVLNQTEKKIGDYQRVVIASAIAESVASLIRVPVEVIKQKRQVSQTGLHTNSRFLGSFYRGFKSMVIRDVIFSALQFTIWEFCKRDLNLNAAISGAISGSLAGFLTTPIDVLKTRIILSKNNTILALSFRDLFKGAIPRTLTLGIGGFCFLGTYDLINSYLERKHLI
jgi:solute carrier family 25 (mitochondrial S-adenosylmethionine transporter), member 26